MRELKIYLQTAALLQQQQQPHQQYQQWQSKEALNRLQFFVRAFCTAFVVIATVAFGLPQNYLLYIACNFIFANVFMQLVYS